MRDDIHKRVPRPPKVQRWVQCALRGADRISGQTLVALEDAVRDVCRSDISPRFVNELIECMETLRAELFGRLDESASSKELNGRGSPMEQRILSECQRLASSGGNTQLVIHVIAAALKDRSKADVRAAEPVLLPTREQDAYRAIDQMKADVEKLDYRNIAAVLGRSNRMRPQVAPVAPDENLLETLDMGWDA